MASQPQYFFPKFVMLCSRPEIEIIVPCYNEAKRLRVSEFIGFCERDSEIGFVFVNDGSLDNTEKVLARLAGDRESQIEVVNLPSNQGKAEAIRAGMKHVLSRSSCELVGYWDADLATPLNEIPRFVELLKQSSSMQFVCGCRVRRLGASVERSPYRHYLGRVFATCASLVLGLPVYDTQCGAKIMRSELARKLMDHPFVSKWFFDVELFARAVNIVGKGNAEKVFFELPLNRWSDREGSKRKRWNYVQAAYDLVRISRRYDLRRR